jgi:Carboxypeptidase regulatory-like domain/TonB dependent receptor
MEAVLYLSAKRCLEFLSLLVVVFSAVTMYAQLDRGSITGIITDPSQAVISGARVSITNVATGETLPLTTASDGAYNARSLNPGTYRVTVEQAGFRTSVRIGIVVGVNQVVRVDVSLEVGSQGETIEVSTQPPLIATETSSLGTIETEQRITELPLNGRNFIQLAYLGPGANLGYANTGANRGTTDNARPGIAIAVNGLQSFDNNFLLDGVDNNEWGQSTLVIQPSPDAISEFRVEENSMKAQFGRGGAAINVVLHSGANRFHGSAFEFFRNDIFDAANYFSTGKPAFHLNQFGGSLGGPIRKDRTFFFADYQGQRVSEGETYISTVPTADEQIGDFSQVQATLYDPYTTDPNTFTRQLLNPANPYVIPADRIDRVGQNLMNVVPLPNLPGLVNNFIYEPRLTNNVDQFDVRLDHRITERDQLFAHGAMQYARVVKPAPLGAAGGCCSGFGSNIPTRGQNYALGWTHTFNAKMLNDLRGAFIRWTDNAQHLDTGQGGNALGIPNADRGGPSSGLPLVFLAGYTTFGSSQYVPEIATDNMYQFSDQFSWIHGKHSMVYGGDFRHLHRNFYQAQAPFGLFAFEGLYTDDLATQSGGNAFADMLLGLPIANLQDGLSEMDNTSSKEFDFFAQDDWRVLPNLTLNLGLRYDLNSPVGGKVGNFDLAKGYVVNNFGPNAVSNAGVAYDKEDWGPRVGFAWSPFKKDSTAVHGAFGIFYAPEGNVFNDLGENPPILQFYSNTYSPLDIPAPQNLLSAGFPDQLPAIDPAAPTGEVKTTGSERKMPRITEWNINVQQEFAKDWLFTLAYVGTRAQGLWANEAFNLDQPVQPLDTNFGPAENYGRPYYQQLPGLNTIYPIDYPAFDINYSALQTKLEKRFSQGFNILVSYTFAHDIGSAEGDPGGGQGAVQNPYNLKAERGNAAPDFRHYFVTSYLYQIPFGRGRRFGANMSYLANLIAGDWELSGITTARTGEHFTVCLSSDDTNTGTFCAWPEKTGNPTDFSLNTAGQSALGCPAGHRSLACWYNQTAFTLPPLAPGQSVARQFGNSGNGVLVGPDQVNFNFALLKSFDITESNKIQFRAEVYNLANHPQFALPANNPDQPGGASISSTLADNQREFQFALKWLF